MFSESDKARFWANVTVVSDITACWLWHGASHKNGYGRFSVGGKTKNAHRYSWALHTGQPLPAPNVFVCHTCDIRLCVNPHHLFLGTAEVNNADMWTKGRGAVPEPKDGEEHPYHKLNNAAVLEIRATPKVYGYRQGLAQKFGVSRQTISNIAGATSWDHIELRRHDTGPAKKTHCIYGHVLAGDNVYTRPTDGCKQCRACCCRRTQQYRARKAAKENYCAA